MSQPSPRFKALTKLLKWKLADKHLKVKLLKYKNLKKTELENMMISQDEYEEFRSLLLAIVDEVSEEFLQSLINYFGRTVGIYDEYESLSIKEKAMMIVIDDILKYFYRDFPDAISSKQSKIDPEEVLENSKIKTEILLNNH